MEASMSADASKSLQNSQLNVRKLFLMKIDAHTCKTNLTTIKQNE